ncbi:hypothetical protein CALVIDRAFT_530346 [Calocera viscosa TUFC12733]|uniref:Uncharacterized protein n=1 Tax=Calocera viscosa (strain TUFC12733) TaxID=1330018 RepID=A0A167I2B0_CALVF|nr:hypothetical protein CALVIDRAFT_530346 [Calocera viscosa TUFC12733]
MNDEGVMKLRYRAEGCTTSVVLSWDRRARFAFGLLFKRLLGLCGEVPSIDLAKTEHIKYQKTVRELWTIAEKARQALNIGDYPGELQVNLLEHTLHARNVILVHDVDYGDTILHDDCLPVYISRYVQGKAYWLWMQALPSARPELENSSWWSWTVDQRAPYVRDHVDAMFGDNLVNVILPDVTWQLHPNAAAVDVYVAVTLDPWCRICGVTMNATMKHNLSILLKQLNKLLPSDEHVQAGKNSAMDGLSAERLAHCPFLNHLEPLGVNHFDKDMWMTKLHNTANAWYSEEWEGVGAVCLLLALMYASFDEEAVDTAGHAFNELAMGYINSAMNLIDGGNEQLSDLLPDITNIPTYIRQEHISSFAYSEAQHLDATRKYIKATRSRMRHSSDKKSDCREVSEIQDEGAKSISTDDAARKTVRFAAGTTRKDGPSKKAQSTAVLDTEPRSVTANLTHEPQPSSRPTVQTDVTESITVDEDVTKILSKFGESLSLASSPLPLAASERSQNETEVLHEVLESVPPAVQETTDGQPAIDPVADCNLRNGGVPPAYGEDQLKETNTSDEYPPSQDAVRTETSMEARQEDTGWNYLNNPWGPPEPPTQDMVQAEGVTLPPLDRSHNTASIHKSSEVGLSERDQDYPTRGIDDRELSTPDAVQGGVNSFHALDRSSGSATSCPMPTSTTIGPEANLPKTHHEITRFQSEGSTDTSEWRHGAFRCQNCQQRMISYVEETRKILADEYKRFQVPSPVYGEQEERQGKGEPLDEFSEEYEDNANRDADELYFLPGERPQSKSMDVNTLWDEKLALLGLEKETKASKSARDSKRRAENREKAKKGIPRDQAKDKFCNKRMKAVP